MFASKIWWITGASSGIGAALAEALAAKGAKLILSGRNEAALAEVAQRCKTEHLILPFEATDFAQLPQIVEQAAAWAAPHGGLYGLVNNAGISQRSLAIDTQFDVFEKIIAVDLLAPIALTQQLLPRFAANGGGKIIAISSVAGIIGAPLRAAYSAAKAGIIGYHDSVRAETAHLGIGVLVVAPGSVRTNVSKNALDGKAQTRGFSDAAIDNGMPADVAAQRIVDALEAGQRELILAEGAEAMSAQLRRSNPDQLFDLMAQLVANGYAKQLGAES
ncbi:SDR family NAD(P)-dependent oxidoreductase [Terricaulis sp.]|uniref:SDR family NAD(P)-dependent oxidoreductase n=1 Tax=Terricaulis sp. TaxID=2768686 RepID=UPI002AC695ED|nr:SDR family NAD(P)-dependent oxidoreductase [Terricaulis sp.]MDZ4690732.1 SDR family NAD(P)-dependent oxidoreductase [Terricaulis sp.]